MNELCKSSDACGAQGREGGSKEALRVVSAHSYSFTTDTPRAFTFTSTPLGGLKTG
jgi:hypothetical protein